VARRAQLLARDDAAIGRYAATKYVNVEVKTKCVPAPNGIHPMMGTIQWMYGYVVKVNQKRPKLQVSIV
jgi:hypothetical protein